MTHYLHNKANNNNNNTTTHRSVVVDGLVDSVVVVRVVHGRDATEPKVRQVCHHRLVIGKRPFPREARQEARERSSKAKTSTGQQNIDCNDSRSSSLTTRLLISHLSSGIRHFQRRIRVLLRR